MAMIQMERKWLYLFEPHTASRATARSLASAGFSKIGHHHIDIPGLTYWRREHIPAKRLEGFKVFSTIRNPFDVLVTKWKFSPFKDKPFTEYFKERKHSTEVTNCLLGLYKQADVILYYEHLKEDLNWVFNGLVELEDRNPKEVTENKAHWSSYYSQQLEMVTYLLDHWEPFLNKFGYVIKLDSEGTPTCTIEQKPRIEWTKQVV